MPDGIVVGGKSPGFPVGIPPVPPVGGVIGVPGPGEPTGIVPGGKLPPGNGIVEPDPVPLGNSTPGGIGVWSGKSTVPPPDTGGGEPAGAGVVGFGLISRHAPPCQLTPLASVLKFTCCELCLVYF